MGLLSGVLLLPLAPVRGVGWVAERLLDAAENELHDPAVVRARLRALNEALERGELSAEDFERDEERLLDLLEQRAGHGRQEPKGDPS
ncbi:gas vesicle protein GvpG [Streptomyces sp. HNM0574]|uniref:gas vesicle protein GvpG n=1 Tax=Streptomyces sp. HNM0574 TaxID=2714954 RepID=UPI00146DEF1C|nr:gas vesicle protein GvpG [Streptomyces sp. HNM0574]NLU70725.1 gas vesicle protein [Streptomyces sp. HNM0574]